MAGENKVRPKGFKAWCENFWYHYKFYTIVVLVVVVTLAVSIAQCSTKTQYDYEIVLATNKVQMTTSQIDAIKNELLAYGEDQNGDGEVNILLIDCTIDENQSTHDVFTAKRQKLQAVLMNNTNVMMIISDADCFEWINELSDKGFIADTGLPDGDGKCYLLDETSIMENAKKACDPNGKYEWPKGTNISRRIIDGTLFEGRDGVEESKKAADAFIDKIIKQTSAS